MKQEYIKRSHIAGLCIQAIVSLAVEADEADFTDGEMAAARAMAMTILEMAQGLPCIEVEAEFEDLQKEASGPNEEKGVLQ